MWLGNTMDSVPTRTYDLVSSVHSMKLLGAATDKDLNLTEHVADIVHRVSNQIQIGTRNLLTLTLRPNYAMRICCRIYVIVVSCRTIVVRVIYCAFQ